MQKITLQIPDMQSAHCRNNVQKVIAALPDLRMEEILPGSVVISVQSSSATEEAILAIENAGYVVRSVTEAKEQDTLLHFKTNINCTGCVNKVSPVLDKAEGICHWEVDTASNDKTLMVHTKGITADEVIRQVENAGFSIEAITPN